MNTPNLFIVGAPKCGTTSMYEYLKQHPDIFMIENKEPQFFNTDHKYETRQSSKVYFKQFETEEKVKYLGEATPMYLYSNEAPENIKKISPDAKIIIMVRRPADIVYSRYLQNLKNGVENAKTFLQALQLEETRKKGRKIPKNNQAVERLYYSMYPKYEQPIRKYMNAFGKKNVKVILFDNLKKDTEKVVRETCEFLEINSDYNYQALVYNKAKKNRLNWLHRFYKYPPKSLKKIARLVFNEKQRAEIFKTFIRFNQKNYEKEDMDSAIEQKINVENLHETEFLEQFLQTDLSHWK